QQWQSLARAQRFQLGEREVLGEPAGDAAAIDRLSSLPEREFRRRRDIGGAADLVLVAHHQRAVARDHEVGLDVIGALLYRDEVFWERVLGHIPAGPAVRYDKWTGARGDRTYRHENCARDSAREPAP